MTAYFRSTMMSGLLITAVCASCSPGGGDRNTCDAADSNFAIEVAIEICPGPSPSHEIFNHFWTAFDRYYALFDVRRPSADWRPLGEALCAAVAADPDDDVLFDLLTGLARELDDGHVQLDAPNLGRDSDGLVSIYPFEDEMDELEANAEDEYLDGPLRFSAQDEISWARIGTIAYMSITSLDELSNSGDEDDDVRAAGRALDLATQELMGIEGLILDLRANGGGWDEVAREISTWFSGPRTLAWSERERNGPEHDDFTPFDDIFIEQSRPEAFDVPVVVLTSGATFSAAEVLVLAMRDRNDVTVLGERTAGQFSDLYDTCLPNKWALALSGEVYRAADGMIYETMGVPVDVPVDFDPVAFASGQDTMLEAAIGLLP